MGGSGGMRRQAGHVPRHGAPLPRTAPATSRAMLAAGLLAVAAASVSNVGVITRAGAALPDLLDPVLPGADEHRCADADELASLVGQVLVVGLPGVTDADDPLVDAIVAADVGGVMLRDENLSSVEQAVELIDGLRSRLGEDLLVTIDEEGGRVTALRALGDRTPSARRLGAAGPVAAREAGFDLGLLARSIGVDVLLSPVADLDDGPYGGVIGDRSFGGDPDAAAAGAAAFAAGLHDAGVAATAKHFPGHGGEDDPHAVGVVDDVPAWKLRRDRLRPFDRLIGEGIEVVMVGHVAYPEAFGPWPASLQPEVYELLRERGFEGVALTDALGMGAVHARWGFDVAPAMALGAGADGILVTQGDRVDELVTGLRAALTDGRLDPERFVDALERLAELRRTTPAVTGCT